MAKTKKTIFKSVTPAGVAAYSYIYKPDEGGKFSDGKYKVTLVMEGDADLTKMQEAALAAAKEKWGKVKEDDLQLPFRDGDETDKEEFEGKVLLTAKSKYPPAVVDAAKNELDPDTLQVKAGDLIKLSVQWYAYEKVEKVKDPKTKKLEKVEVRGVSAQLRAIQLLEKRTGGGGGADDFEDESDQYGTPPAGGSDDTDSDGDADPDDF